MTIIGRGGIMSQLLSTNAEKWLDIIKNYHGDPSKYGLPKIVFQLPSPEIKLEDLIRLSKTTMNKINPRTTNPYTIIDSEIPQKPAILYMAVWDAFMEEKNRALYQDIQYNFQELIQNFIREELKLFSMVRPFRKKTGSSVLSTRNNPTDDMTEVIMKLNKYSSPQKILHQIAHFVKDKTIQSGIAYILLLDRFSSLIAKTRTDEEIEKVVIRFEQELERLESVNFKLKIPSATKKTVKPKTIETVLKVEEEVEIIYFTKIELQEYDGYVEISGFSQEENRNFRIYDCEEEDMLREEMWKQRKYPLRRLVNQVLDDRYSRPTKEYQLKYGVEIVVLPPNWTT